MDASIFWSCLAALCSVVVVMGSAFRAGMYVQRQKDKKKIEELESLVKKGITVKWQDHE